LKVFGSRVQAMPISPGIILPQPNISRRLPILPNRDIR
jgi:hypothetical protein